MTNSPNGFIKLQRAAEELFLNDLDAYLLLTQIAFRALRQQSKYNKKKLQPNQALIGDYEACHLTERRYRDAKDRIEFEYKIATFKGTNKGTIATLLNTEIYDINSIEKDEQKDDPRTNKGRTKDEQDFASVQSVNDLQPPKKLKKERNKEEALLAKAAPSLASSSPPLHKAKKEASAEDLQMFQGVAELNGCNFKETSVRRWFNQHEPEYIHSHFQFMLKKKKRPEDPEAWLEIALRNDYIGEESRIKQNRDWVLLQKHDWLQILKIYCRDVETGNEYYFRSLNFQEVITQKAHQKRQWA